LADLPSDVRDEADSVWGDLLPSTTRKLNEWESQFGLPDAILTEQQRRDRLAGTWVALAGGQSPRYIQDTLQAAGFDVYVHEWWDNGTTRNPLLYLRKDSTGGSGLAVECGTPEAACGEVFAECGNRIEAKGYPLVNKITESKPDIIPLAGEAVAACGEDVAACGYFTALSDTVKNYTVPGDPAKWPFFLYIGGQTFGDTAYVTPRRRDEFEALCLKICPTQLWLGILVEYE
jgi:hypothetical protein